METVPKHVPPDEAGGNTAAMSERKFCPRCAIKHLGKAKVLLDEARLGYPMHTWLAMANMSEAEDEIVEFMPTTANEIRAARIQLQDSLCNTGGRHLAIPDFEKLMMTVGHDAMLEEMYNE